MLRQSQLPPRAPFRCKEIAYPTNELSPTKPPTGNDVCNRHKKSFSQSSVLEDQPAWMDDLLSDIDSAPGLFHCRSASDSVAFLDDLVPHSILLSSNDDENSSSDGNNGSLESTCMYGPNSPRRKVNVDFNENSMLAALSDPATRTLLPVLKESYSQKKESYSSCGPSHLDSWGNGFGSTNELNAEPKAGKRHPRQRSRVRKLQYIAELERTVSVLQALESELQYKVSSMLQQRLTLSVENNKLKQHMSRLQHQKRVVDSEHQTLRQEAERLKSGLARSSMQNNKVQFHPRPRSNHVKASEDDWQMLNWAKLNLG